MHKYYLLLVYIVKGKKILVNTPVKAKLSVQTNLQSGNQLMAIYDLKMRLTKAIRNYVNSSCLIRPPFYKGT